MKTYFRSNKTRILVLTAAIVLFGTGLAALTRQDNGNSSTEVYAATAPTPPWQKPTEFGKVELDRSKPVPPKDVLIKAWQKRQDAIKTFRFVWTEQQTHPKGWISNPRFPERERSSLPALLTDRSFTVNKTLAVDGGKMRYSFELDRKDEPDGISVMAAPGDSVDGLGSGKHYSYIGVFDGQAGKTTISSLTGSPPAVVRQIRENADAQNLDNRAIMLAMRPLDPVMGHLLVDRAVANQVRSFYKGRSIFLLEEQRDPSGWKTLVWVEPERNFLVSRVVVSFEQRFIADIDIDYKEDAQWGWVPGGWRITARLADDSKRVVCEAKVTSYSINQTIESGEFR